MPTWKDPGKVGCQHFEPASFMLYRRVIDTAGYLVLWQVRRGWRPDHEPLQDRGCP